MRQPGPRQICPWFCILKFILRPLKSFHIPGISRKMRMSIESRLLVHFLLRNVSRMLKTMHKAFWELTQGRLGPCNATEGRANEGG